MASKLSCKHRAGTRTVITGRKDICELCLAGIAASEPDVPPRPQPVSTAAGKQMLA